jgi:hypothetical protein
VTAAGASAPANAAAVAYFISVFMLASFRTDVLSYPGSTREPAGLFRWKRNEGSRLKRDRSRRFGGTRSAIWPTHHEKRSGPVICPFSRLMSAAIQNWTGKHRPRWCRHDIKEPRALPAAVVAKFDSNLSQIGGDR